MNMVEYLDPITAMDRYTKGGTRNHDPETRGNIKTNSFDKSVLWYFCTAMKNLTEQREKFTYLFIAKIH